MGRRVVVTGLGTVNPLGNNVQDFWRRIRAGENGIGRITRFDVSDYPAKIAGELKDFAPEKVMESKDARRMDRFTQYAMVAGVEAMAQAGLAGGQADPERLAVVIGNGIGGVETLENNLRKLIERGPKAVHPLFVPMMIMNEVAGNIAIRFKANGPCFCVVTACASSNDAMGDAWRLIREGRVDVAIAGGTEAGITPLSLAGFCQLQALSTKRNDDPEHASRPFGWGGTVRHGQARASCEARARPARRAPCSRVRRVVRLRRQSPRPHRGRGTIEPRTPRCPQGRARRRGLRQRARHLHPDQRPHRDEGHQGGVRRSRPEAQGVLDEVDARAPSRRCGRHRGGGDDHGDP
jgi:hypothetical protein